MENGNVYKKMLDALTGGIGVLTSNEIHSDIPTIHMVGNREGSQLKSDTEVRHAGFGLFFGEINGSRFSFDGGGAMYRGIPYDSDPNGNGFSWTLLRCDTGKDLAAMGYNVDAARAALQGLAA